VKGPTVFKRLGCPKKKGEKEGAHPLRSTVGKTKGKPKRKLKRWLEKKVRSRKIKKESVITNTASELYGKKRRRREGRKFKKKEQRNAKGKETWVCSRRAVEKQGQGKRLTKSTAISRLKEAGSQGETVKKRKTKKGDQNRGGKRSCIWGAEGPFFLWHSLRKKT